MAQDYYISFGATTGELEAALARTKAQINAFGREMTSTARQMAKDGADMDSQLGQKLVKLGTDLGTAKSRFASLKTEMGGFSAVANDNAAAIEKVAGGFNRMQQMEAGHVAKAVIDEIAAGQSPMRAFAMESGRIGQILAGLPPQVAVVGGAIAALAGTLGYLVWRAWEASAAVKAIQLDAAANQFSIADDEAKKLRKSIEDLAGVSAGEAEKIYKPFAALGPVGATIAQLVSVSLPAFAEQMGKKVPEAAELLAGRFINLDSEGKKWVNTSRLLTAEQQRQFSALVDGGQKVKAYEMLVDLLTASLGDVANKHKLASAAAVDHAEAMWEAEQAGVAFNASQQRVGEATAATTAKIEDQKRAMDRLRVQLRAAPNEPDYAATKKVTDAYDPVGAKKEKLKADEDALNQGIWQDWQKSGPTLGVTGLATPTGTADDRAAMERRVAALRKLKDEQKDNAAQADDPLSSQGVNRDLKTQKEDAYRHEANVATGTREEILAAEISARKKDLSNLQMSGATRLALTQQLEAKTRELRDATDKAGEKSAKDQLGATTAAVEGEIRAVTDRYQMEIEHISTLVKLKKMGVDQGAAATIAALKKEGAEVDALYTKELALSGLSATKKQEIRNKQLAFDDRVALKEQETQDRAAAATQRAWEQVAGTIESSLNGALRGMITGTQTFKQSMSKALEDLGFKVLELGEKWAMNTFVAPNLGPMISAAAKMLGIDIAQTTAGATAWFAPMLGPAAPAAGAAVGAAVAAGGIGMMDIGAWSIPQDQLAMVHRNELVMPAAEAGAFRSMLSGAAGGGGAGASVAIHPTTNVHVSALDGASVSQWMRSNSAPMMRAIDEAVRHGATRGLRLLNSLYDVRWRLPFSHRFPVKDGMSPKNRYSPP